MLPILSRYGSIFIYSYTVVMAVGVLLATWLTSRLARRTAVPDWFDTLLIVFVAAVLGGRFGFVLGQWNSYFREQPREIWQFSQGGLSYHGALVAGILALLLWTAVQDRRFYRYAALFTPGAALLAASGWLACWLEGCAYGRPALSGLLTADLPDAFGVFALRYQTQLLGFLLTFAAFLFLLWFYPRLAAPLLFWSGLIVLSLAHLIPTLLRYDTVKFGPVTLDVLLDGALIIIGALMVQYSWRGPSADRLPPPSASVDKQLS